MSEPIDTLIDKWRREAETAALGYSNLLMRCARELEAAVASTPTPAVLVDAVAALRLILVDPHGCSMCDSGKLRDPSKEHWASCGFALAQTVIEALPCLLTHGESRCLWHGDGCRNVDCRDSGRWVAY